MCEREGRDGRENRNKDDRQRKWGWKKGERDPSFTHSHSFLVMVDFSSFTPAIYVWEINFRKV